jgi:lysophospholipase L1-like esterase
MIMKNIFAACLVIAVFWLVFGVGRFYWRVRVGKALAAAARPYERILPDASFRMLVIGDSTALGTGVADPRQSVAGLFGERFPHISVINRGKNGRLTSEIVAALDEFPDNSLDLIVMHTGGNDIIYFTSLDELVGHLEQALLAAKRKAKHVAVLHSGNVGTAPIFPRPLGWLYTARTRRVRDIYINKAQELDVVYVDLFAERSNDPFLQDIKNSYAADYLHLGPRGNEIWFEKIVSALSNKGVIVPSE